MDKKILEDIERFTRDQYPKEACGVVLNSGEVLSLPNTSETPETNFKISGIDFYTLKDKILYIFHSHTKKKLALHICTPSLADVKSQKRWKIPFLIAGFDGYHYTLPIELPTKPSKDYLNRPYIYGISDCGYLMRDYYLYEFNIELNIDPELAVQPKNFWAESIRLTLIANNFENLGQVQQLRRGDILINSIGGGYANHGAIFISYSEVLIQNEVSEVIPYELIESEVYTVYRHERFL